MTWIPTDMLFKYNFYITNVSFSNLRTFSRLDDVDLITGHIFLASYLIVGQGGFECEGKCVVATCCLLI